MTNHLEGVQKHYKCIDCGARLWKESRAEKHRNKTGHATEINHRATLAHMKYRARQNPSYLTRLDRKIAQEKDAWL